MTKRYVLNPDTKRLVDAEGCVGVKIINKLTQNYFYLRQLKNKQK